MKAYIQRRAFTCEKNVSYVALCGAKPEDAWIFTAEEWNKKKESFNWKDPQWSVWKFSVSEELKASEIEICAAIYCKLYNEDIMTGDDPSDEVKVLAGKIHQVRDLK